MATDHEDKTAISDVLTRYMTGIDRRDWSLYRTCFTDDVQADFPTGAWSNLEDLASFMEEWHADLGLTVHHVSNIVITVNGDTATSRCYGNANIQTSREHPEKVLNLHGFYDDTLVRTPDGWKISQRTTKVVSAVLEESSDLSLISRP
ncbi:nuclear transport factor 2 family protein [Streptomyces sp. NPDC058086]|uniref:nuclear transport factor 2 family protein n=1 Tax=Streptomyces sp. NPDC058086 TaxID=3346334 RepID=UPI0036E412C1